MLNPRGDKECRCRETELLRLPARSPGKARRRLSSKQRSSYAPTCFYSFTAPICWVAFKYSHWGLGEHAEIMPGTGLLVTLPWVSQRSQHEERGQCRVPRPTDSAQNYAHPRDTPGWWHFTGGQGVPLCTSLTLGKTLKCESPDYVGHSDFINPIQAVAKWGKKQKQKKTPQNQTPLSSFVKAE